MKRKLLRRTEVAGRVWPARNEGNLRRVVAITPLGEPILLKINF